MYLRTLAILVCVGLSTQQTDYCSPGLCRNGPHIRCNGLTTLSPSCGALAMEIPMTLANQALILKAHNSLRNTIASGSQAYGPNLYYPQAARMATLQWDQELAENAAANARSCVFGNDRCRNTAQFPLVGQNVALGIFRVRPPLYTVFSSFINLWYSENISANPDLIAEYPIETEALRYTHFAQVVADRATHVGCALARYFDNNYTNFYFVCNYSFANYMGGRVYQTGRVGSKCYTQSRNPEYTNLCNPS